jgi:hypothetical protein
MPRALTKRAYARHAGVSESAVRKAIKSGRITERSDGKIDPAIADRQWARNTDPTKPLNRVTGKPKHRKPSPDAPSEPLALDGKNGNGKADHLQGFSKARAMRETLRALREKILYELDAKKTIEVSRVESSAAAAGEIICNRILMRSGRLARVLAGVSDVARCRKILNDDARKTCEEVHKALEKARRGEK